MVIVEPTSDLALIHLVLTDERIFDRLTDDYSPKRDEIPDGSDPFPGAIYLLCRDEEEVLGLIVGAPFGGVELRLHPCLLPTSGGDRSREAGRQAISYFWFHTRYIRIIGIVPSYNHSSIKFLEDIGMLQFGFDQSSFQKNDKVWDQIYLGISKE